MKVARTLPELQAACTALRAAHGRVSLVPTMGALHAGHLSLVARARAPGDASVASIFVNPLQFGPKEDLSRYPRTEDSDLRALEEAGCDLVWLPSVETMVPSDAVTAVDVEGPANGWEGTARPGHFRGVATICARLFGQVRPDRAVFGEKDWQQLQVVSRMVRDLHLPLQIDPAPTIRESDGLALSSRNRFLTPEERKRAPLLYETLRGLSDRLACGIDADAPLAEARSLLEHAGLRPDYLALVDAVTLRAIPSVRPPATRPARIIVAAKLGSVRLLDNIAVA